MAAAIRNTPEVLAQSLGWRVKPYGWLGLPSAMNLGHVLSWGSSISSLSSLGYSSNTRERVDEFEQWQTLPGGELRRKRRSSPVFLKVLGRGSYSDSRRTNGYSRSKSSSNTLSSRPRGPREQNNDSNRNAEGSRERYGGYAGRSEGSGKNSSRNSRNSGSRYGGGRGSGSGGGGNRGRGDRRDRVGKMHPGAYTMRDEQTGDLVVVWGVEDDDDIPMPTAADLNWRKATIALPGDASEETWAKIIEEQSGSSGSYTVRGVEPEGKDWTDDLFDEDPEPDFEEDGDFLHNEDYSDSESEELAEISPKVVVSRAPRVKVFGRDLWGKSLPKVKVPENDKSDLTSASNLKEETLSSSDTFQEAVIQKRDSPTRVITAPSDSIDGRNRSDDNAVHNSAPKLTTIDLKDDNSLAEGTRTPNQNDIAVERSVAAKSDEKFSKRNRASISDKVSTETSRAANIEEKSSDGPGAAKINKISLESRSPKINDGSMEGRNKGAKVVEGGSMAIKTDDEVKEGGDKATSGFFNPYILDISEEDGNRSHFKQQNDVKKSGLLDRLRSQVLGTKPATNDLAEEGVQHDSEQATAASRNDDREDAQTPVDDVIRPPMRDLTARDNYDASIADDFFSLKSFKDLGATPEVIQALSYLNVQKPSQIQAMAFKPILEGKSCIIAEQTGSGKTLAYVAPLAQRLKADEARALGKSLSKKPRVLVLAPTGELAAQVLSNFRALSKGGVPCRSIILTGGFKWKTQVESLEGGADVVVATPGRLLQQLEAGNIHFDNLKSVVLDEVDILFDDEDFSKALQTINKAASIKVQYIHVTATLPVDIHNDLLERYPDCLSLMGPSLHRTAIGLQEVLVDCSGGEQDDKTPESAFANKRKALLQLVEERPVAKTIIFCNKVETCRKVENVLTRYDRSGKKITVLPYHAALAQETRLGSMETFLKSHPKERLFLVCTDRASRGIDSLDVEHVVLFDFPRDPSEYVRRVGRTARGAGGTGRVFAFVVGRQVGHARRIMARNDRGEPVHDVPGSRYYYRN